MRRPLALRLLRALAPIACAAWALPTGIAAQPGTLRTRPRLVERPPIVATLEAPAPLLPGVKTAVPAPRASAGVGSPAASTAASSSGAAAVPAVTSAAPSIPAIAAAAPLAATGTATPPGSAGPAGRTAVSSGEPLPPVRAGGQVPGPQGPTGRILGRVIDRETGRAMQGAQVLVVGTRLGAAADLDGRYEIPRVPAGVVAVVARQIGYRPVRFDSIVVRAGQPTTVNFGMASAPSVLAGVTVTAEAPRRSDSDVGLLAQQKSASAVSDGISSAAIARSPAGNAAEAVVRVPGIAVVDNRFVQVRGLAERYSGTTLNGTEIPSPEPTRRIVPLDIFPAKLLESIVATKTGTPDKQGDFTGGLVEVTTKEFPEEFSAQVAVGQSGGNLTTGVRGPFPSLTGSDFFGFGVGSRTLPADIPRGRPGETEFAASARSVQAAAQEWTPATRLAVPNTSFEANMGGRGSLFGRPIGFVAATTYSNEFRHVPERQWVFRSGDVSQPPERASRFTDFGAAVDLSGLMNVSFRPATWSKVAVKTIYTRNADDLYTTSSFFNFERSEGNFINYQRRYIMRDLLQVQGSGEHTLGILWDSRLEWKYAWAEARRLEPQNRSVPYTLDAFGQSVAWLLRPSMQERTLNDIARTMQVDWSLPFGIFKNEDGKVKLGGQWRTKTRTFSGVFFTYDRTPEFTRGALDVFRLLPNELFQPEFMGPTQPMNLFYRDENALPYLGRDEVASGYAMLDLPVRQWLRVAGGVRYEDWRLRLTFAPGLPGQEVLNKGKPDALTSVNVTARLSPRTNLRLGYFDAVSRPDPREFSPDQYIAVVGECGAVGDPFLQRTRIANADIRLEHYPDLGELVSFSTFYKRFQSPIIENNLFAANSCTVQPANVFGAINYGAEFEWRRALRPWLQGSLNATYVLSRLADEGWALRREGLAGVSPWVINGSLGYGRAGAPLQATVLVNYFSDRLFRFNGIVVPTGSGQEFREANIYEIGRLTLDARVSRRMSDRWSVAVSARNLLGPPVQFVQRTREIAGDIPANVFNQAPIFGMKVTYDVR
jgi:hypothetical protein